MSTASFSASSLRNLLPRPISGKQKPNSHAAVTSESDTENAPPADPNIQVLSQRQQLWSTKRCLSKLPASKSRKIAGKEIAADIDDEAVETFDPPVKVVVRIRPTNDESWSVRKASSNSLLVGDRKFTLDAVLDSNSNQEDIFQLVGVPLVRNALSGYNASILSYGQTGSGKTYTMWGPSSAMLEDPSPSGQQGIVPRIFQMLFSEMEREKEKSEGKQTNYQCRCSFLEIHNGQIGDLLYPTNRNLEVRDEPKNGLYVENLTEEFVNSYEDVAQILMKGLSSRKVGTTSSNSRSTRSHVVFSFIIESWCKQGTSSNFSTTRTSRISLVDLAGAERNKLDDVGRQCVKEEKFLKKSLSQLGYVVNTLATGAYSGISEDALHKGSCLTHLLRESLGGNAKLTVICTISPENKNTSEILSTLRFGQKVKSIRNVPLINEISEEDVNDLSDQIRQLKEELIRAKSDVYHSVGNRSGYFRERKARDSLNQLRVSLNRSLILPELENDDEEEVIVDDDDIKELHEQLNKLHGSCDENIRELLDSSGSVQSSFVSASCEPDIMSDDEICSHETEIKGIDFESSEKECHRDNAAKAEELSATSTALDSALRSSISISPCRQASVLQEPILSESPKIRNSLRKSMAVSSSFLASQNMSESSKLEAPRESEHIRSSLRSSKIFPGPTESLAASLQRGLQIIDYHQRNMTSNRSSVSFPFDDLRMKHCAEADKVDTSVQTSIQILQEDKPTDGPSSSLLCPSCLQKFENYNNEIGKDSLTTLISEVDGARNPNQPTDNVSKGTNNKMEEGIDREKELENMCREQSAKIEQLTHLLEQYKLQTEKESKPLEEPRSGDQLPPAQENKLLKCNDIKDHQPEVIKETYEIKQVDEEYRKRYLDINEKEALVKEIASLKSKLQSCTTASPAKSTDELRSSLLARSIQLRKSVGFQKITEEELEKERLRWTEMESEWISLTDELRLNIENQRRRAEKAETELRLEKSCTEELDDALHRAVLGHARFVEHYTELQEKYNDLAGKHKATMEGIAEVKRAVAKAGGKGHGSRFANALAAELSALRIEKERERDLLKKENKSLKIQLRDTAEAVHAAGELLVRLREAEQAASAAEENLNKVQEDNEKLKKKIEKLKRRHKMEMITMKQYLAESRLPESALQQLHQDDSEVGHQSNQNHPEDDQAWRAEFGAIYQQHY